jgi:hypothetical protein|tara:strand:- start:277 stop:510 length:234 start_codon:yes stop_codon:yes gene_type:complete
MFSYKEQVGGKKKSTLTPKQLKALKKGREKLREIREKNKRNSGKTLEECRSSCKPMGERTRKQRLNKNKCYLNCKFN